MSEERFVGIDVHKRQVVVAAVDAQQQEVLKPVKVAVMHFQSWAKSNLRKTDQIAIEATSNSWAIHDLLLPLVANVSVANSYKLKLISASARKTDIHDALVLASLSTASLLPTIWVPPQEVRELRRLMQHRTQLVQKRSSAKTQLLPFFIKTTLASLWEANLLEKTRFGGPVFRFQRWTSCRSGIFGGICTISTS